MLLPEQDFGSEVVGRAQDAVFLLHRVGVLPTHRLGRAQWQVSDLSHDRSLKNEERNFPVVYIRIV